MTGLLILATLLLPLGLIGFAATRPGPWLVAVAALPALLLAALDPAPVSLSLDWLLLGTHLGLDQTGRQFLAASALVWLLSAVYAAESLRDSRNSTRFRVFFLLAMSGNFMLILAQDMATFYLGFTLMGLSAYGLVAHRASVSARRAGRLYLIWTIFGEVVLFSALVLLAAAAGGSDFAALRQINPPTVAVALLLLGFGIKLALPGLHLWLPPSYAAAPAAGVAVLSGPMMGAGFLGWLRFLPEGSQALIPWGELLILIGLFGSLYGVVMGLLQTNPKVVLGYSSISKMGLVSAGFGIALTQPGNTPELLTALVLFVLQHQLLKSAMFVGVDLLQRGRGRAWIISGMIVLGLALIGAPFTGGALAKTMLVSALPDGYTWFADWMLLAAAATTLLMGRLLFLLFGQHPKRPTVGIPAGAAWSLMLGTIVLPPVLIAEPHQLFSGGLSLLSGVTAVCLVWLYRPKWLVRLVGLVPPGDILHPLRRLVTAGRRWSVVQHRKLSGTDLPAPDLNRMYRRLGHSKPGTLLRNAIARNGWNWAGSLWMGLFGLICLMILTWR